MKCERKIQAMIDCMKDLEFRFQEKKNLLHGQVNVVNKTFVPTNELNVKKDKDFVDLGNNIEACTIEL